MRSESVLVPFSASMQILGAAKKYPERSIMKWRGKTFSIPLFPMPWCFIPLCLSAYKMLCTWKWLCIHSTDVSKPGLLLTVSVQSHNANPLASFTVFFIPWLVLNLDKDARSVGQLHEYISSRKISLKGHWSRPNSSLACTVIPPAR